MPKSRIESRLLLIASGFLILNSLMLTLAPAGRARSWEVEYRWEHWAGLLTWIGLLWLVHFQLRKRLPDHDPYLLPLAGLLSGWGLLTIWRLYSYFGWRQAIWLLVSGGLLLAATRLSSDLRFLRRYKYLWLSSGLILTALTLLLGTNPLGFGPRLWLGCCGVYLQPSEPLKFLLVVYLAAYLAGLGELNRKDDNLVPLLAPTLIMTGLALALLLGQRDLGTATIFLFLFATLVYLATGRWQIVLGGAGAVALAGLAGYLLFDVVRLRIDAWLNPWLDPSGRSYQIVQSIIAIANGGIFGRGLGLGSPGLVPIPHSDFIYTAIAEESGLVGTLGLLILLALLAQRGLQIAIGATGPFRRLLAAGLTVHLVAQSILIISGNIRLLPLTGVTLPFVSYGGSSLVTSFASLAILLHISNREEDHAPTPLIQPAPYLVVGGLLLAGLSSAGLVSGWWAVQRGPALLARTDNPRRALDDLHVPRGALVDRSGALLVNTSGETGAYSRQVTYAPLSVVLGYNHPIYGQAGLEASLDEYLRGISGYPAWTTWWHHLLYGTPPPGLDVRLTINREIQAEVDQALEGQIGAVVLVDAASGEILVMASHPNFDANTLDEDWENLVGNPNAPLLNRTTQGRYPTRQLLDRIFPEGEWPAAINDVPQVRLLVAPGNGSANPGGQEAAPQMSPLQVAGLAAALTNEGIRPGFQLAQAVKAPAADWVLLPTLEKPFELLEPGSAGRIKARLSLNGEPFWGLAIRAGDADSQAAWFSGGTLPESSGMQFAVVVLLEYGTPEAARAIGVQTLNAATGRTVSQR